MATRSHGSRWRIYLLAGVLLIIAAAAWLVGSGRLGEPKAPRAPGLGLVLPKPPPMPEGPKMPNPPIPVPR